MAKRCGAREQKLPGSTGAAFGSEAARCPLAPVHSFMVFMADSQQGRGAAANADAGAGLQVVPVSLA